MMCCIGHVAEEGGGWYWGHGEYIGPGIGEGAS